MDYHFSTALNKIVNSIQSLQTTLPLLFYTIETEYIKKQTEQYKFAKKHAISEEINEKNEITFQFNIDHYYKIKQFNEELFNLYKAKDLLPKGYLINLVGQYDAFFGDLLRTIFLVKPEILNSSEKNLVFSQVIKFKEIEDIRKYVIEKEVETVLRESHIDQIKWLETKLGVPFTKNLDIWQKFVETTERRNLLVHADGIVSDQYLQNCNNHKVEHCSDLKVGDCLSVDLDYFNTACDCFFEFCVKIANVLWRRLLSEEIEKSDEVLNQICFDLISSEKYDLAINLLEFGTVTCKDHSSEQFFVYMQLNRAQAYKWSGNEEKCQQILGLIDWSAKKDQYLLVRHVLKDEFEEAAIMMVKVNIDGSIAKSDYKSWPIFREFRKSTYFQEQYRKVFGEEFQITESSLSLETTISDENHSRK